MKNVLVLCDDLWHPAEVIERGMKPLEEKEYRFDFVKAAKDILTEEMLENYPLIICCKGNNIIAGNSAPWFETGVTEVMAEQFRSYVERGGAFLAVHAGNCFLGTDGVEEYTEFVGNRFIGHPPRCTVNLKKEKENPVMKGVQENFSVRDEHYQIEMLAEDADIFLTSSSEKGGTQIAGYTREIGQGRLCVLTPGHTLSVWENPEFRKMLLNAMAWCLNEESDQYFEKDPDKYLDQYFEEYPDDKDKWL